MLLSVEDEEGHHAELTFAQELDARLCGRRVLDNDLIEGTTRRRDGHVILIRDRAEVAQPPDDAGDVALGGHQSRDSARARRLRIARGHRLLVLGARAPRRAEECLLLATHARQLGLRLGEPRRERLLRFLGQPKLFTRALHLGGVRGELGLRLGERAGGRLLFVDEKLLLALRQLPFCLDGCKLLRMWLALALLLLDVFAQRLRLSLEAFVHGLKLLLLPRDELRVGGDVSLDTRHVARERAHLGAYLAEHLLVLVGRVLLLLLLLLLVLELLDVLDVLSLELLEGLAALLELVGHLRVLALALLVLLLEHTKLFLVVTELALLIG
mmetsp:Transcript_2251/g.4680  ORF Transcript_2251/g.4680 Transcript_2251/m.4680 type:complete len:327 (-) Transcript_2251:494-1474(-)